MDAPQHIGGVSGALGRARSASPARTRLESGVKNHIVTKRMEVRTESRTFDRSISTKVHTRMGCFCVSGFLLLYVAASVVMWTQLQPEWGPGNATYFVFITLTTTGYGDFYPVGARNQVICAINIWCNLVILGVFAGQIAVRLRTGAMRQMARTIRQTNIPQKHAGCAGASCRWWRRTLVMLSMLTAAMIGSSFWYSHHENWSFAEAFYWSTCTVSSVGYGDLTMQSDAGKAFSSCFAVLGTSLVVAAVGTFADDFSQRALRSSLSQWTYINQDMLELMDYNNDGKVDRAEFLETILIADGSVKPAKLQLLNATFARLDKDNSGELKRVDIQREIDMIEARTSEAAINFGTTAAGTTNFSTVSV